MPSLNRHGIGSGKYRIGGTYPENIMRVDLTKSRQRLKEIDLTDGGTDNSFQSYNLERDIDGNLYVGGNNTGGVAQLKKYTKDGDVVWRTHIPHPTSPDAGANQIQAMCHGLGTDLLYVWTYGDKKILALDISDGSKKFEITPSIGSTSNTPPSKMQATEDYLIVGYNLSSSTNPTLVVYNHSGDIQYQFTILSMRSFYFEGNALFVADNTTLYKMELTGVRTWEYTLQGNNTSYSHVHFMECDNKGNVWLLSLGYWSTNSNTLSYLYIVNGETGALVRKHQRSSDSANTGYPDNINTSTSGTEFFNDDRTMLLPSQYYGYMVGNGVDYPLTVSRSFNSYIYIRSYNDQGDTYGTMVIKPTTSQNYAQYYKPVQLDEGKNIYISTQKIIYVVDPKTYYKIQY